MTTVPAELARVLMEKRASVVPVVGAGLARAAGLPGTDEVADALRRVGSQHGLQIPALAGFVDACEAFECRFGLERLQDVTAKVVRSRPPLPDKALRALVRCPSRIVLTTNYDCAVEEAVRCSGRKPRAFGTTNAHAWSPPPDGVVHVVHLHGVATKPWTMVFPGASTDARHADEAFKAVFRAIAAPRVPLYLGFSFGVSETHLRAELDWLAHWFTDAGEHHVLLPSVESAGRGGELEALMTRPNVRCHFYDDAADGHLGVLHAALVLAPRAPAPGEVVTGRAPNRGEYFLAPPLLTSHPGEERTVLDARSFSAELGLGAERYEAPEDLVNAGRVLLDAGPGMGKTQALLVAGESSTERTSLYLPLTAMAGEVAPGLDPLRAALLGLRHAQAFDFETPRPSVENLDDSAYGFLLDGFDEVSIEQRAGVLAAIKALVDRYPQHAYVVATRPTIDAAALYDLGFERRVLVPGKPWGRRYLRHRSVPDHVLAGLADRLGRMMDELVAVPIYAAAIATRLLDGKEIPTSPLALLIAVERDASRVGAERVNPLDSDELFDHLQGLALAMQLRGSNEAPTSTLAETSGRGLSATEALRNGMVQRALLQDREGIVAFPSRVMQEALCADAILGTADPGATVRTIAAAEVAGEPVLRDDMDHVLDLVWESASVDARARLREVDEVRWARTQAPGGTTAQDALDLIWNWFERRRIWLCDDHHSREARGAETAVERLLLADPDAAERRRVALIDATRSASRATRGNAVTWLTYLPAVSAPAPLTWLAERIEDESSVVRRHACVAAERLGVREALPQIRTQLACECDESALGTLGHAALALAEPDERRALAFEFVGKPLPWRELGGELASRIDRRTLLELLDEPNLDREVREELLGAALAEQSGQAWNDQEVELLSWALVAHARDLDLFASMERVEAIVAGCPEAAIRGAQEGARRARSQVLSVDLLFVRSLPADLLRAASDGPLGGLMEHILPPEPLEPEVPDNAAAVPVVPEPSRMQRPERRRLRGTAPPPAARRDHVVLAKALDRGLYSPDRPPRDRMRWPVGSLTAPQRTRLEELVGRWWVPPLEASVVLAAAALDLPVSPRSWRPVFASGAVDSRVGGIAEWLHRHYAPEHAAPALDVIGDVADGRLLLIAAYAMGALDEAAAAAIVGRLPHLRETTQPDRLRDILGRVADGGHLGLIREVLGSEHDIERRQVICRVLAERGDHDAQVMLVRSMIDRGAGFDPSMLDWRAATDDETLVELLGELLTLVVDERDPDPFRGRPRAVRAALAMTRSERALKVFDRLADDPDVPSRAFEWYPRNELARSIATERVLERLPEHPAGVVELMRSMGFER